VASAELLHFVAHLSHRVPQQSHCEHAANPASGEFDVQGLSDRRPAHVAHIRAAALAGGVPVSTCLQPVATFSPQRIHPLPQVCRQPLLHYAKVRPRHVSQDVRATAGELHRFMPLYLCECFLLLFLYFCICVYL
jgi:hypothetical protein